MFALLNPVCFFMTNPAYMMIIFLGTDYVGRGTTVTSCPVTIDSSLPALTGTHIHAHFEVDNSETTLHTSWKGVFMDQDSGECIAVCYFAAT